MHNEAIFIFHSLLISISALIALFLGQHALVTFISIQCLLANLFVLKQITLFGFHATCADPFTIGATLGLNLLQEYFGKTITQRAIIINTFILLFYTVMTQIHLCYSPNIFDTTHIAFLALLSTAPRIIIASVTVYTLIQFLDCFLYGTLKTALGNRFLVMRNYISIIICQFFDTVLFTFLGLWGIIENPWHVIFISYSVKLIAILIATPFVLVSGLIYKKAL